MSTATSTKPAPVEEKATSALKSRSPVLLSGWIWGPIFCVTAFFAIQNIPAQPEFLSRHISGRGLLSLEVGLFCLACAGLVRKLIGLIHERRSLKLIVIDAQSLTGIASAADRASALLQATADVPKAVRGTRLLGRIRAACEYVAGRASAATLEEHLRYLGDLAVEDQSASFAGTRTIAWMVPALGIVGALIGIAEAAGTLDSTNLSASVPLLVAGLAASFQELALALGLSLVLALFSFVVERKESRVLARIERFGMCQLAPCLGGDEAHTEHSSAFVTAEEQAAEKLLERTESLINRQTGLWQTALEEIRTRWLATCQEQQTQFSATLKQGMSAGLASHVQQLDEARAEFLKGFRAVGLELTRVTAGLQQMGQEHQDLFHRQVTEIWGAMQAQLASARDDHQAHMAQSLKLLDSAVKGWRKDLTEATSAIAEQLEELRRRGEVLNDLAGQEQELVKLQTTLAHNLQSVRAIEAFEESIHSLNAAVHMLTIRAKAHAA